jgi:hypothetical protein
VHGGKSGCGYGAKVSVVANGFKVDELMAEDRLWLAKVQELAVGALPDMRSSADKWATALTTALAAVSLTALVAGPGIFKGLTPTAGDVAKGFFFAGALAALVATIVARLAAQPTRKHILNQSGDQYRQWSYAEVNKWHRPLGATRWFAALAMFCVLVCAGILWFGDQAASNPTIIDGQGTVLCPKSQGGTVTTIKNASYLIRCGN